MSDALVPKEQQSAYQRWEMAALSEARSSASGPRRTGTYRGPLPTAAEIERVHQAAHDEGRAAGLAEGRQAGRAASAQLQQLLAAANREMRGWDARIAGELVDLAVEIAQQVVREALSVKRELIVPVVRDAIAQLPLLSVPARLAVHPADAELVREELGEQLSQLGWKVIEEETVERGGCRVEGGATRIDATVAVRWERVLATLGRDRSWLERGGGRRNPDAARSET